MPGNANPDMDKGVTFIGVGQTATINVAFMVTLSYKGGAKAMERKKRGSKRAVFF